MLLFTVLDQTQSLLRVVPRTSRIDLSDVLDVAATARRCGWRFLGILTLRFYVCPLQRPRSAVRGQFSLHVEELEFVRHSMEAWKANLHMPLGIDVFWQEHVRGDAAPSVELLERWEIMCVVSLTDDFNGYTLPVEAIQI